MSRLKSAPFFSAHPVFRRAEYAAAVGRESGDKVVTAMLAQHLKAGNIRRIARSVFASVPKHADARTWSVDRFLAASRMRAGGVVAYHSALELHGYAYTEGYDVQVIAPGEPRMFEANGLACRFVRPPRGFTGPDAGETDGVMLVDRLGLEVKVTTLARADELPGDGFHAAAGELHAFLDSAGGGDATAVPGDLDIGYDAVLFHGLCLEEEIDIEGDLAMLPFERARAFVDEDVLKDMAPDVVRFRDWRLDGAMDVELDGGIPVGRFAEWYAHLHEQSDKLETRGGRKDPWLVRGLRLAIVQPAGGFGQ